jgi:hypothetical protein
MEPLAMDGISRDDRAQRRPLVAFTCPKCGKTSHHPDDERHGYCANCHDFTASPVGSMPNAGTTHLFVDGIVAARDHEPYVRVVINGEKAQLSIAEAHKVAHDILKIAARTEADAVVLRFFSDKQFPKGAGVAIMRDFRDYRYQQDEKKVEGMTVDPDSGTEVH